MKRSCNRRSASSHGRSPADEWDAIALNYTSGTTGDPKGVVYHHRGAYLNALSNILEWDMPKHAVYLWTLPLFHCNGWCFPWTVAARAGVNVCLRKFDAKTVFDLIRREGITHYCGAPIVQSALANAPAEWREGIDHRVSTMVAGAAPSPAVIAKMKEIGFDLTHVYGLTETYGPAAVCAKQEEWDALDDDARARSERAARRALSLAGGRDGARPGYARSPCRTTAKRSARSCFAAISA